MTWCVKKRDTSWFIEDENGDAVAVIVRMGTEGKAVADEIAERHNREKTETP